MEPEPTPEPQSMLEHLRDPAAFLAAAGSHLAEQPVLSTVVATVAERAVAEVAAGIAQDPRNWYVVARDAAGRVVGTAMRTAPFAPRPLFVLPMPETAARLLARELHARGEEVAGANGALPAVRTFAEETARLVGRTVEVDQHTRLFQLGTLVPPPARPSGALRQARGEDAALVLDWFHRFHADADEQAGRPDGTHQGVAEDLESVGRRIADGRIWLWEVDGEPVHLTQANQPAFGVSRIGPVYTPKGHRGRGYASAAVAEVSALVRDGGARVCLFTDQANPTSNALYQRLGYEPVVDMVNLRLV